MFRFLSILVILVSLALVSAVPASAQTVIGYRFYMWSDANYNSTMDVGDICWRSSRPISIVGIKEGVINPIYYKNLVYLSTYYMGSPASIVACQTTSFSPTLWLQPSYPYFTQDYTQSNAITYFTTPASGGTQYVGIQVPW